MKLVNKRLALFSCIPFACGILFGYALIKFNVTILLIFIIFLIACIGFIIFDKGKLALLLAICTLCGTGVMHLEYCNIKSNQLMPTMTHINGTIDDCIFYDNYAKIILTNITISDIDSSKNLPKQNKVSFIVYSRYYEDNNGEIIEYINIGDIFECDCRLWSINVFADGIATYEYHENIRYRADTISNIITYKGQPNFLQRIRLYIKTTLKQYMSEENSAISVGMLLGDTSEIEGSLKDAFRRCGITHIFSVSGLHIGFVIGLATLLLRKLIKNKVLIAVIALIPAFAYGMMVGFSASVLRALIMSTVALIVWIIGSKADMLTSCAIAFWIVLLISPINLFDAGCLMSFGAVFGIATLGSAFGRWIDKFTYVKLRPFILSFGISLGATLGSLPIVIAIYHEFSLLGLICNVLFVPIITVLFIAIIIGLIPLPIVPHILYLVDHTLTLFNKILVAISKLPFATIEIFSLGFGAVLLIVLLFVIGGFVNLKPKVSRYVTLGCTIGIMISSIFASLPASSTNSIRFYNNYGSYMAIITNGDQALVFGDIDKQQEANSAISYLKWHNLERKELFMPDPSTCEPMVLDELLSECEITKIYSINRYMNELKQAQLNSEFLFAEMFNPLPLGDMLITRENTRAFRGYRVEFGDITLLIVEHFYVTLYEHVYYDYDFVYAKTGNNMKELFPNAICVVSDYAEGVVSGLTNGDFLFIIKGNKIVFVD